MCRDEVRMSKRGRTTDGHGWARSKRKRFGSLMVAGELRNSFPEITMNSRSFMLAVGFLGSVGKVLKPKT
jgi:hypothetical protein